MCNAAWKTPQEIWTWLPAQHPSFNVGPNHSVDDHKACQGENIEGGLGDVAVDGGVGNIVFAMVFFCLAMLFLCLLQVRVVGCDVYCRVLGPGQLV